jgi:hypothetical protein
LGDVADLEHAMDANVGSFAYSLDLWQDLLFEVLFGSIVLSSYFQSQRQREDQPTIFRVNRRKLQNVPENFRSDSGFGL